MQASYNAHSSRSPRTLREILAVVLWQIRENDTNYPVRYGLIWEAMGLACQLGYPAGVRVDYDAIEPRFPIIAYIELPAGQVSWHMPPHTVDWDGHTTDEKLGRISDFVSDTWGIHTTATTYRRGVIL